MTQRLMWGHYSAGNLRRTTRLYLFLLLLALPIDYFSPTASLLREGGAKPAVPLMIVGALYLFIRQWRLYVFRMDKESYKLGRLFLTIGILGSIAFAINLCLSWSYFGGGKNPIFQFFAQGVLYLILPFIVLTHAELFSRNECVAYLLKVLPIVTGIHLMAVLLQMVGWLKATSLPLSLFHTPSILDFYRPSGMMSEPSYVGAMSAMYGLTLILLPKNRSIFRIFLGVGAFIVALAVNGKTVVPVMIAGLLGYMWYSRVKILSARAFLAMGIAASISVYVVVTFSALDVSENLSSAMRLGSAILAINAAWHGYGITGVGFGQFHFFYRPEFAPEFLRYSQEALDQFSKDTDSRAATYNMYARYLIETGVLGLGFFVAAAVQLFRMARQYQQTTIQFGIILFASSLGYMMTADFYCHPPLAFGMALILGGYKAAKSTQGEGQF